MSDRQRALAWEARWSLLTAVASFAAVALVISSFLVVRSLGGGGEAEELREIDAHSGSFTLSIVMQAIGFALLAIPLAYLFQAGLLRSDRMRSQFRSLIVAGPLALAASTILIGVTTNQAASDFVTGKSSADLSRKAATRECVSDRKDDKSGFEEDFGSGSSAIDECATEKVEDDAATNATKDVSLRAVGQGFQLGGVLAFVFALVYCSLNALRTGLLTKFWGSLGIALGVASVLGLFEFTMLWFVYFGLLVAGWVPGGRPPAWAAGEAIPWPSPGEKMADGLGDGNDGDGYGDGDGGER